MIDILIYLGITLIGVCIGVFAKRKNFSLKFTGIFQTIAIILLVLFMGIRMGSNQEVIDNLGSIGIYAFAFTLVTLVLVTLCMFLTRKLIGIDRFGIRHLQSDISKKEKSKDESNETKAINSTTVAILCSVVAGMLIGFFFVKDAVSDNYAEFSDKIGFIITCGLCLLLFFVGIDIGLAGTIVDNFKKVGARVLLFPLANIIATLGGGALCCLFVPITLKEGLAVAAGFGWYTLAPGIIMEAGLVTASAISFMHNVMRELFSIIFMPFVAKKVGYIETFGLPGACAMDVCLPLVEKSTNSNIAVYSFISGAILSLLVPILVPFILAF